MPRTVRALTRAQLLALPAAIPLWPDAAQVVGVGRSKAYEMAQNGEWPTRLLRLGNAYRVPTAELLALLGVEEQRGDGEPQGVA